MYSVLLNKCEVIKCLHAHCVMCNGSTSESTHCTWQRTSLPCPSTINLSIPRGPSVVRTASTTPKHAVMLLKICGLPWEVSVPSFRRMIGACCKKEKGKDFPFVCNSTEQNPSKYGTSLHTKDPTMNLGTDYRLGLRGFLLVLGLGKFILPVWSLSLYMCPTANPLTKDTPSRLWCLLGLGAVWVWCAGTRACTNMEIQHAKRTVMASKLTHWGR